MADIIGKGSIATLVNGVCDRNFRAKEARIQRSFENYQQLQQHAHDEKLQWNDHQFMREMQDREHEFQLKQQKDIFENNKKEERRKEFLENSWPLSLSPEDYLIKLEEYKNSYGLLPLNVIIPNIIISGKSLSLTNIDSFFNDCYKYNSISPVLERSGDWKNDFLERTKGNALLQNLRMVFRLPTLVVLPEVVGDDLRINVSYWGMLDQEDPAIYQMFSLNLQELKLYIMRKKAKEEWHGWQEMKEECPTDTNAYIWHEEELFAQMKRLEKIEDITIQKFCDIKYGKKYLEKEISDVWEREETLHVSWLINLTACIISDIYFLTEYDVQPKFAKLLKQMPVFFVERQSYYTDLLEAIFLEVIRKEHLFLNDKKSYIDPDDETQNPFGKDEYYQHLEKLSDNKPGKRLGYGFPALHAALIAQEFHEAGNTEASRRFFDWAVEDLKNNLQQYDAFENHKKTIDILKTLEEEKDECVNDIASQIAIKEKEIEGNKKKIEENKKKENFRKRGIAIPGEDWKINFKRGITLEMVWV